MTDPLYFIEIRGRTIRGQWFLECDRDNTYRDALKCIRDNRDHIVKVLEINEAFGTCRDVTEEMKQEARETA